MKNGYPAVISLFRIYTLKMRGNYRRARIYTTVAAMLVVSSLAPDILPVAAQQSGSLPAELAAMEANLGLPSGESLSLFARLGNIETKVFGSPRAGSIVARVESLDKALAKGLETPQDNQQENSNDKAPAAPAEPPPRRGADEPVDAYIKRMTAALPLENVRTTRFFRMEPVVGKPAEEPGDYLEVIMKATSNKVIRFKEMPVPVYITPFADRQYMRACIQGFENWEQSTRGMVRFVQVDDPAGARIRVIWSRLGLKKDDKNCALGAHTVTKWKKKGPGKVTVLSVGAVPIPLYIPKLGPKYKVPAQVIEVNLDLLNSRPVRTRLQLLENLVTHELGHAMGMLGHSQNRKDMMYAVTDEYSRISPRDVNTLTRLYKMKVEIPL
ncbi:MAG: matrixin family metalloprotease [Cyanobacteria bacterium HKST-UBA02]|nr:matrixin family metalloprotease [Cyanobacteria bacterium HKST-UBA02]